MTVSGRLLPVTHFSWPGQARNIEPPGWRGTMSGPEKCKADSAPPDAIGLHATFPLPGYWYYQIFAGGQEVKPNSRKPANIPNPPVSA